MIFVCRVIVVKAESLCGIDFQTSSFGHCVTAYILSSQFITLLGFVIEPASDTVSQSNLVQFATECGQNMLGAVNTVSRCCE